MKLLADILLTMTRRKRLEMAENTGTHRDSISKSIFVALIGFWIVFWAEIDPGAFSPFFGP